VERAGVEPWDVEHINYVFRLTIGLCVWGVGFVWIKGETELVRAELVRAQLV
jgi:hypothetical protein